MVGGRPPGEIWEYEMKVLIKVRESKLFNRLVLESLHFAVVKYQKRKKWLPEEILLLEANLKLQLQNGIYHPQPPEIYIHRENGRETKFAKYKLQDEIVMCALYELLTPVINEKLLPQCIGGRKGSSRHSFLGYLKLAKEKKLNWILITDVANYFYSISHNILEKILSDKPFRIPKDIRNPVMSLIMVGTGKEETKGILPGNALAKLLGNIYLHPLDIYLSAKNLLFCRYIDDIGVFVRTKKQAETVLEDIKEFLKGALNLQISERKTGIYHRYFNSFDFLGFHIIGEHIQPTEENCKKFVGRIEEIISKSEKRGIKKVVRALNRQIYNFAHAYKMGAARKLYGQLDEIVRREFRKYLRVSSDGVFVKSQFNKPSVFPVNLAFNKEQIYQTGLVSLVEIKNRYDRKKKGDSLEKVNRNRLPAKPMGRGYQKSENIQIIIGNKIVVSIPCNVGIGTTSPNHLIELSGGAYCDGTGDWMAGSDRAYKKDIDYDFKYGLAQVKQLKPVSFIHQEAKDNKKQIGFIAQDVIKVIPEIVSGEEGAYGLSYGQLTAVLVKAMQEQGEMIRGQQKAISALEQRLAALEGKF